MSLIKIRVKSHLKTGNKDDDDDIKKNVYDSYHTIYQTLKPNSENLRIQCTLFRNFTP